MDDINKNNFSLNYSQQIQNNEDLQTIGDDANVEDDIFTLKAKKCQNDQLQMNELNLDVINKSNKKLQGQQIIQLNAIQDIETISKQFHNIQKQLSSQNPLQSERNTQNNSYLQLNSNQFKQDETNYVLETEKEFYLPNISSINQFQPLRQVNCLILPKVSQYFEQTNLDLNNKSDIGMTNYNKDSDFNSDSDSSFTYQLNEKKRKQSQKKQKHQNKSMYIENHQKFDKKQEDLEDILLNNNNIDIGPKSQRSDIKIDDENFDSDQENQQIERDLSNDFDYQILNKCENISDSEEENSNYNQQKQIKPSINYFSQRKNQENINSSNDQNVYSSPKKIKQPNYQKQYHPKNKNKIKQLKQQQKIQKKVYSIIENNRLGQPLQQPTNTDNADNIKSGDNLDSTFYTLQQKNKIVSENSLHIYKNPQNNSIQEDITDEDFHTTPENNQFKKVKKQNQTYTSSFQTEDIIENNTLTNKECQQNIKNSQKQNFSINDSQNNKENIQPFNNNNNQEFKKQNKNIQNSQQQSYETDDDETNANVDDDNTSTGQHNVIKNNIDFKKINETKTTNSNQQIVQIKTQQPNNNQQSINDMYSKPRVFKTIFPPKNLSIQEAQQQGNHYLWDFQFENADRYFQQKCEEDLTLEEMKLEKYILILLISGKKKLIKESEQKLTDFLENLEIWLKQKDKRIITYTQYDVSLVQSEIFIFKGLLQGLLGNKFQSFLNFRQAYNHYDKVASKVESKKLNLDSQNSQSRFKMIKGAFNMAISMMPSFFQKFLNLIGVKTDKKLGIQILKECQEENSLRSMYSSLLLCINYVEIQPEVQPAVQQIKMCLRQNPTCPVFYWMSGLLNWRYSKPADALLSVKKSLHFVGEENSKQANYLIFEKGWFFLSMLDWQGVKENFQTIAKRAFEFENFDQQSFQNLCIKYKLQFTQEEIDKYTFKQEFLQKSQEEIEDEAISIPQKCCISLMIACALEEEGDIRGARFWLLIVQYIYNRFKDQKTLTDDEIVKLTQKYLKRDDIFLIKFESLYFVKEVSKLPDPVLQKMLVKVQNYVKSKYSLQNIDLENILEKVKIWQDCIKNKIPYQQEVIEIQSYLFLHIVEGCLNNKLQHVFKIGNGIDVIQEFIPSDFTYLLHHSYLWLGKCYGLDNQYSKCQEYFKKSLKYKNNCEFQMGDKVQKMMQEYKRKQKEQK